MIEVQLPDGSIAEFPEGTPSEVIKGALQKRFGAPQQAAPSAPPTPISADDVVRSVARGVPGIGGAMDEVASGLNTGFGNFGDYGRALEYERERDRQYDEQHPIASTIGQVTGGVMGLAAGLRNMPGKGFPTLPTLQGKVATGGALGAGAAGLEGFTRGQGGFEGRLNDALGQMPIGGAMGMGLPMAGHYMGKAWDAMTGKGKAVVPSTEQIRAQKTQAYDIAKQSGLVMRPEAVDRMAVSSIKEAMDDGLDADLTPKAFTLYKRLDELRAQAFTGGDGISLNEIENLRKKAVRVVQGPDRAEGHFAGELIGKIDDFLESAAPGDVISGNPMQAAGQLNTARGLAKQQAKSEMIDEALRRADIAAQSNYNQAGIHQAIKREFSNIAKNKRFKRNFSPEEQDAIMSVVNGGPVENTLRRLGMGAPKGGLSQMLHIGSAYQSGGATVPLSMGLSAAQHGAARSGINRAGRADAMIKGAGPNRTPTADLLSDYAVPFGSLAGPWASSGW